MDYCFAWQVGKVRGRIQWYFMVTTLKGIKMVIIQITYLDNLIYTLHSHCLDAAASILIRAGCYAIKASCDYYQTYHHQSSIILSENH